MARLFISYSRQNIEMARRITEDCKQKGIDFWIDWDGIEPSLDWWKEIEKGIEQADNFLFLISPDSIASAICRREIEHGVKNGKRLVPVVVQKVRPQDAPPEIASLNWIFLDEEQKFADGMHRLVRAIDTDFAWVEFHRRLQVKALEWERGKRDGSLLLRGRDLQDAEAQLATHASTEPPPTKLQREYALMSRQASDRQRARNTVLALSTIAILAILSVVAVLQANRATRNESIALSRQLSAKSKVELLANKDRRLSLLYALEALNTADNTGDFQNIDAVLALRDALEGTGGEVLVSPETSVLVQRAALSPLANWLALDYRDKRIGLWDLQTSQQYLLSKDQPGFNDVLYFSPGGKYLVLLSNPLQIWETASPSKTKHTLQLQALPSDLEFSPDETWLVIDSKYLIDLSNPDVKPMEIPDGSIRVVGPQANQLVVEVPEDYQVWLQDRQAPEKKPLLLVEDDSCNNGEFSPDGRWLALFCDDATRLWDLDRLGDPQFPRVYPSSVIVFSPDGTLLALTNVPGKLVIVDPATGSIQDIPSPALYHAAFSPDHRWFAGSTSQGEIRVWDLSHFAENQPITLLPVGGYDNPVADLAFTADSLHLLSTSDDGITRKWDLLNPYAGSFSVQMPGWSGINDLSYSADGRWLVISGATPKAPFLQSALLDLDDSSRGAIPLYPWLVSLVNGPRGDRLISVNAKAGEVESWPFAQPLKASLLPSPLDVPGQILNSMGGRWLMTRQGAELQVWDLAAPEAKPKTVRGLQFPPNTIGSLGTNGKWLWRTGQEQTVRLWDLEQPEKMPVHLPLKVFNASDIQVSPGGKWMATLADQAVQIWDLRGLGPVLLVSIPIPTGDYPGSELLFSADDRRLVIDSKRAMRVVDLKQPHPAAIVLPGQVQEVTGTAISADGNWLAANLFDLGRTYYETLLWNLADPQSEPLILPREGPVDRLAFSPDGRWLAAGLHSLDRKSMSLDFQRVDLLGLRDLACKTVGSNLSRKQWLQIFPPDHEYRKTCPDWPVGPDKEIKDLFR